MSEESGDGEWLTMEREGRRMSWEMRTKGNMRRGQTTDASKGGEKGDGVKKRWNEGGER